MPKWKKCGNFLAKQNHGNFEKMAKTPKLLFYAIFFNLLTFKSISKNFWCTILREFLEFLVKWWKLWVTNYTKMKAMWPFFGKNKKTAILKNGKKHQNCDFGQLLLIFWLSKTKLDILSVTWKLSFSANEFHSVCRNLMRQNSCVKDKLFATKSTR